MMARMIPAYLYHVSCQTLQPHADFLPLLFHGNAVA